AHSLKDLELEAFRQARRGQLRALEIAVDATIQSVRQLLVHLLEIVGEVESPPHPRVLELVAADVERIALHEALIVDRKLVLQDASFLDRREVIGSHPILGTVLVTKVELVALECLERDGQIAEIFVPDLVEVLAPGADAEVLAPIVLDPLVDDPPPDL